MSQFSIDKLAPGMVLSEPAVGPRGNVLIGAGVELSSSLIDSLRKRGVEEVSVESGEAAKPEIPIPDEVLSAAAEELAPRFKHSNREHPVVKYLFEHVARENARLILKNSTDNK